MTTVAIDFGTSNTIVSIIEPHNQQPKSLKIPQSRIFQTSNGEVPVIPSLLFFLIVTAILKFILGNKCGVENWG